MSIIIEKGIPVPTRRSEKYPLYAMEVGDSFVISGQMALANVRSAARHLRAKTGKKFIVRKATFHGPARCWRVA